MPPPIINGGGIKSVPNFTTHVVHTGKLICTWTFQGPLGGYKSVLNDSFMKHTDLQFSC